MNLPLLAAGRTRKGVHVYMDYVSGRWRTLGTPDQMSHTKWKTIVHSNKGGGGAFLEHLLQVVRSINFNV